MVFFGAFVKVILLHMLVLLLLRTYYSVIVTRRKYNRGNTYLYQLVNNLNTKGYEDGSDSYRPRTGYRHFDTHRTHTRHGHRKKIVKEISDGDKT